MNPIWKDNGYASFISDHAKAENLNFVIDSNPYNGATINAPSEGAELIVTVTELVEY